MDKDSIKSINFLGERGKKWVVVIKSYKWLTNDIVLQLESN